MPRRLKLDAPLTLAFPLGAPCPLPMPGLCPPPKFCGKLRATSPRSVWPALRISSDVTSMTGAAAGAPATRDPVTMMGSAPPGVADGTAHLLDRQDGREGKGGAVT